MSTTAIKRIVGVAVVSVGFIFVLLVSMAAISSSLGFVRLPIELYLLDQRLPVFFRIHMAASGLALVLGLLTILLRQRPRLHRPIGRLTAALVVIGGLTALPSALYSESTLAARAGFFVQGCVWLSLLVVGVFAIRNRDVTRHRRAMISMYTVATGAIWLRMITAATAYFALPFDEVYAAAAWLGWLMPLSLVWWVTRPPATPEITASAPVS